MDYNTIYNKILTDDTLRETMEHGTSDFPFCFYYDNLCLFDGNLIDWHWHTEFEFVWVEQGSVAFYLGEEKVVLGAGEGVFINSRVLHCFHGEKGGIIPNFVFRPAFLAEEGTALYEQYLLPVMQSGCRYAVFRRGDATEEAILQLMADIGAAQELPHAVLRTKELVFRLWQLLYEARLEQAADGLTAGERISREQILVQLVMQEIHRGYQGELRLSELAQKVSVSKSTLLHTFKRFVHTTPMQYLISYRLKKARERLRHTEEGVAQIARETGFADAGYFCRVFKKQYGISPGEFRKEAGGAGENAVR